MKFFALLMVVLVVSVYGQPTIDGSFDDAAQWGAAVATSDGVAGWAGVNVGNLYVTYDASYAYFGARLNSVADWQSYGFVINTKSGGGTTEVWTYPITYGHTNAPDYVIKGHFGQGGSPYCEFRYWNGSTWVRINNSNADAGLASGDFNGNDGNAIVEIRILLSLLENPTSADVQFYVTGNNQVEHATFDAVPDDQVAASWNTSTILVNYATGIPLPVQLISFHGVSKGGGVVLTWSTATEIDNYGFDIERANAGTNKWAKIGFVGGHGTTNVPKSYSFTDANVSGPVQYRLKQIDRDGTFEYSQLVTVNPFIASILALKQNYPNPFNPATTVAFTVPATGPATLKVFNILGQEVASLFNGVAEAGRIHQAQFNADGLSGGMYFSRLEQNGNVKIMKMQLVK